MNELRTLETRWIDIKYEPMNQKELMATTVSAKLGDEAGMVQLGIYYHKNKEWKKGTNWLLAAAERKWEVAYLLLGDYYYYDINTGNKRENIKIAKDYYNHALATFDDPKISALFDDQKIRASFGYANCCYIEENYEEAAKFFELTFELAKRKNYIYSQESIDKLTQCYRVLCRKFHFEDYKKALTYCRLAIKNGSEDALYTLDMMQFDFDTTDWEGNIECLKTAIKMGYEKAEELLGQCYYKLNLYDKAIEMFLLVAQKGSENVYWELGASYYRIEQYEKAVKWLTKSAETGNSYAMSYLHECHYYLGNYEDSIKWYNSAVKNGEDFKIDNLLGHVDVRLKKCYYEVGENYRRGKGVDIDYHKALEYLLTAAERGNENAYFSLGWIYCSAKGVENDFEEGKKWYIKSAEAGEVVAMNNLGWEYYDKENYEEAVEWFQKAVDKKYSKSENLKKKILECYDIIASNYFWGNGVKQDVETAMKWYIKAAENGKFDAVTKVCDYYYYSKKDSKTALKWAEQLGKMGDTDGMYIAGLCLIDENQAAEGAEKLRAAADKGHRPAMFSLGEYYRKNENHTAAFYWYKRSVEVKKSWMKKSEAYYQLGRCYHYGLGTKKNYQQAYLCYKSAKTYSADFANLLYDMAEEYYRANTTPPDYKRAVKYFIEAQSFSSLSKDKRKKAEYIIGFCYYHGGYGIERNYKKALLWLERAYNNGMEKAAIDIANCYFYGKYCLEKDYEAVIRWLKPLADKSRYAQFLLGECYSAGGCGIKANPQNAFFYYNLSAEGGNTNAMYALAQCYLKGVGVKSNTKKGAEWLKKAADNGHPAAAEEYKKYKPVKQEKKPASAPRSTERKPETTANSSRRNNYPPKKTPAQPYRKNTKSLYELNMEYKRIKPAAARDVSAHSLSVIFKSDVVNVLICYLREIICYAHKNSPDWFSKNIIEQDRFLIDTPDYKNMVINRSRFESISQDNPFSVIKALDISALCKILGYRMENKNFVKKCGLLRIRSQIMEYRNSLFHSGDVLDYEIHLNSLDKILCAMKIAEPTDLQVKKITEEYLLILEGIYNNCKGRFHGN